MVQVRFIALCDRGHIQDFPWREWVHRTANPSCEAPLRLVATGGASLAATRVECACGSNPRTLEQITEADTPTNDSHDDQQPQPGPSSYLTRNLAQGTEYRCEGRRPWLGEETGLGCERPLRGSLRGATNVYFALVRSAIYLPRGKSDVPAELIQLLENPPIWGLIGLLRTLNQPVETDVLRLQHGPLLRPFTDDQLRQGIVIVTAPAEAGGQSPRPGDDQETAFRRAEHETLQLGRVERELHTAPQLVTGYASDIAPLLRAVTLVQKLRETRALAGFARVYAENDQTLEERKGMLWRDYPARQWLPAYKVFGEGIFVELNSERLRAWERRPEAISRVGALASRFQEVLTRRRLAARAVSPRFVLVHTVAHLLMNQLTFDCGYSTASLRERLYVSTDESAPMAGILIYTAAGDAEGTMGGLVRMGKAGNLEPVVRRAVQNARWCSADPVCMELGSVGGQGPDSCNLAACHNCALAPETSCEEFNRFLDRWLVVGTVEQPDLGFFAEVRDRPGPSQS